MCQSDYDVWVGPRLKDHWYTSKSWWVGDGIAGGAIALDAFSTTSKVLPGYPYVLEGNKALGHHPSRGKLIEVASAEFSALTIIHALAWHFSHQDPSRTWRFIGAWSVPAEVAAAHIPAAIHNFNLPSYQCPKGLTCQ
jgi:hypothetical protein